MLEGNFIFIVVLIYSIRNCKLSRILNTLMVIIGVVFFSGVCNAAPTCDSPAFAVENVRIDEIAETGTKARENGLSKATSKAFNRILTRLLLSEEDVSALLSKAEAQDYLGYFHIHNETTLAIGYLGEIDFCFDAKEVRRLFRQNGLAWAELVSPPILTIPIWREASGAIVWSENNNWLNSWNEHSKTYDGLLSFVSIKPNIKTQRQLREDAIFAEKPEILKLAINAVGASQLLTVTAEIDHYTTIPLLRLSARLFDENASPIATLIEQNNELNGTKNIALLFEEFQYDLISELEKFWKQKNIILPQSDFAFRANVSVETLSKWRSLQENLSSMPIVRKVDPILLSDSNGLIQVTIAGSISQFTANLNSVGYILTEENDEIYISEK